MQLNHRKAYYLQKIVINWLNNKNKKGGGGGGYNCVGYARVWLAYSGSKACYSFILTNIIRAIRVLFWRVFSLVAFFILTGVCGYYTYCSGEFWGLFRLLLLGLPDLLGL